MSSAGIPDLGDIVAQIQLDDGIVIASLAILYYDYFLTLPDEVDRFWSSRMTWASSFFYLNRYLTLLGHCPVAFRCLHLISFHQYLSVVIQVIVGILFIMRVFALYNRNKWILGILCSIALSAIVFSAWGVKNGWDGTGDMLSPTGCLLPKTQTEAKDLANAWTVMLGFDIMIFGMTLYKSWTRNPMGNNIWLHIFLRDGAIYFGVVVLVNILVIVSFWIASPYEKGSPTITANIISSIMISRLMLNLRDPKLLTRYQDTIPTSIGPSELIFTTVIDTMALETTLQHTSQASENDMELV